ncbi:SRPBCC domain-containing protein [Microbacterium sp. NPDC058342]|uniref:SRPBCC domain-containing protein n=1 Tax=Microbacterium sp. NPDC058342 TaxID=3346454 RepID=UPI00364B5BE6
MNTAEQINAVTRSVEHTASEHVVVLEQAFPTTPGDLWDACTSPERLSRWFEPIDGDLVEGGRYRLTGSGTTGTITQCSEPHALRITWEHGGDTSIVDVSLTPAGQSTVLTLRHSVPDDEHWRTYGPAAPGIGWDGSLLALGLFLAGDHRSHPEEMAKLHATDEGRDFIAQSAESWQAAHIAAGSDSAEARAMAGRTAAFYRGE